MKSTPILFSAPMICAILSGAKTQTRRAGKVQSDSFTELGIHYIRHATKGEIIQATYRAYPKGGTARWAICECPYGIPGDRLWVRETWGVEANDMERRAVRYRADGVGLLGDWRPSIYMPRWASRLTLEIVSVRVERVQDISEADAVAEGIEQFPDGSWRDYIASKPAYNQCDTARDSYRTLWDSINGQPRQGKPDVSWAANPWVWVIEFRKVEGGAP